MTLLTLKGNSGPVRDEDERDVEGTTTGLRKVVHGGRMEEYTRLGG